MAQHTVQPPGQLFSTGIAVIHMLNHRIFKRNTPPGLPRIVQMCIRDSCNSARLVKKGGLLFYSTCTLNPEENGAVAERFLREHPDYAAAGLDLPKGWRRGIEEPANQWTLFPCLNGPDGFFMAAFRRS